MKNPKSFYKKLKKLIEEECPEGCRVVYDTGDCYMYVIKEGYEFNEGKGLGGSSWHGVMSPVNTPSSDVGHEKDAIVGEGIYVGMEAVQDD
jgi:hypothetical protein